MSGIGTKRKRLIGRWLGIAHRIGSNMTYWILTKAGHVIARSTVQHVVTSDMTQPVVQELVKAFDTAITIHLMDDNFQQAEQGVFYLEDEDDDPYDPTLVPTDAEYGDMITDPCPDVDEIDVCDKYLNVFIVLIVI